MVGGIGEFGDLLFSVVDSCQGLNAIAGAEATLRGATENGALSRGKTSRGGYLAVRRCGWEVLKEGLEEDVAESRAGLNKAVQNQAIHHGPSARSKK
jgi:hypothetical protein